MHAHGRRVHRRLPGQHVNQINLVHFDGAQPLARTTTKRDAEAVAPDAQSIQPPLRITSSSLSYMLWRNLRCLYGGSATYATYALHLPKSLTIARERSFCPACIPCASSPVRMAPSHVPSIDASDGWGQGVVGCKVLKRGPGTSCRASRDCFTARTLDNAICNHQMISETTKCAHQNFQVQQS